MWNEPINCLFPKLFGNIFALPPTSSPLFIICFCITFSETSHFHVIDSSVYWHYNIMFLSSIPTEISMNFVLQKFDVIWSSAFCIQVKHDLDLKLFFTKWQSVIVLVLFLTCYIRKSYCCALLLMICITQLREAIFCP